MRGDSRQGARARPRPGRQRRLPLARRPQRGPRCRVATRSRSRVGPVRSRGGRARVRLRVPGGALEADRGHAKPPRRRFYGMLLGGLACNNVLPVRIGEFLARLAEPDAPMPGGRALGSVVLDRVCDVVTLASSSRSASRWSRAPAGSCGWPSGASSAWSSSPALLLACQYATRRARPPRPRPRAPDRPRHDRDARGADRPSSRRDVDGAEHRHLEPRHGRGGARRPLGGIDLSRSRRSSSPRRSPSASRSRRPRLRRHVPVGRRRLARPPRRPAVNEALAFTILMQASWYVPTTLAGGAFIGVRALRRR